LPPGKFCFTCRALARRHRCLSGQAENRLSHHNTKTTLAL